MSAGKYGSPIWGESGMWARRVLLFTPGNFRNTYCESIMAKHLCLLQGIQQLRG